MKRNSSLPTHQSAQEKTDDMADLDAENWDKNDPLWELLSKASQPGPDPFFARNVVRTARLDKSSPETMASRILRVFSLRSVGSTHRKLALSAAACACAILGYQIWPAQNSTTSPAPIVEIAQVRQSAETASNLSELVIEETLLAAADDPSMFTRDEVVTMLGL